jgi:hypothetical protein
MNAKFAPEDIYAGNIIAYSKQLALLRKKGNGLGWARLSMIIFPALLIYFCLPGYLLLFISGMGIVIAVFLWLVVQDINNGQLIKHLEHLVGINREELNIITGDYSDRADGKTWEIHEHAYAADLDIFGPSSLFQYYNRCTSEQGMKLLAGRFQEPLPFDNIFDYQQATMEMSEMTEWRQNWQAIGRGEGFTIETENRINSWLELKDREIYSGFWKWVLYIFPVISIGTLVLFMSDIIPFSLFIFLMIGFFYFSGIKVKEVNASHSYLSRILPEVDGLYKQLHHLEESAWTSPLINLWKLVVSGQEHSAGKEFYQLKKILNRFDVRLNLLVNPILNIFFLWDIRQLADLQVWKKKNREGVSAWIAAMAETDVLNSMAAFTYNHGAFCFPVVDENHFHIESLGLGHPLISEGKRVTNDIRTTGTGQILLITGSNMAGKSTFLRSVGVNAFLAMMGSPVCASRFAISYVHLISSMRIADNLAENTSTFYAELKKLKTIIDRVNQKEKLLILMDEILRGTNSFDRHAGSEALIEQMIQQEAISLVATHDVELGALEKKYPLSIHNYHFDVQVKGEELYFDFKLKEGICQSMNASILMKKIGIHL